MGTRATVATATVARHDGAAGAHRTSHRSGGHRGRTHRRGATLLGEAHGRPAAQSPALGHVVVARDADRSDRRRRAEHSAHGRCAAGCRRLRSARRARRSHGTHAGARDRAGRATARPHDARRAGRDRDAGARARGAARRTGGDDERSRRIERRRECHEARGIQFSRKAAEPGGRVARAGVGARAPSGATRSESAARRPRAERRNDRRQPGDACRCAR